MTGDRFEIHLNGMVYIFDADRMADIQMLLDEHADEVREET